MGFPPSLIAPTEPLAAPAGRGMRCERRWPGQPSVSLPLELAFWALWHCRHARPPDAAPF
ncbi:hypothetical protein DMX10_10830 [Pseudomonas sp. 57B-090624]|nr:hypothetical protein DMX10_10830 [Pseudomonas sp. 57B-090624]